MPICKSELLIILDWGWGYWNWKKNVHLTFWLNLEIYFNFLLKIIKGNINSFSNELYCSEKVNMKHILMHFETDLRLGGGGCNYFHIGNWIFHWSQFQRIEGSANEMYIYMYIREIRKYVCIFSVFSEIYWNFAMLCIQKIKSNATHII